MTILFASYRGCAEEYFKQKTLKNEEEVSENEDEEI